MGNEDTAADTDKDALLNTLLLTRPPPGYAGLRFQLAGHQARRQSKSCGN